MWFICVHLHNIGTYASLRSSSMKWCTHNENVQRPSDLMTPDCDYISKVSITRSKLYANNNNKDKY